MSAQTYDDFATYTKDHTFNSLLGFDSDTILLALELAGPLAAPLIQSPVTYFPALDFAVSPFYDYRHLNFAGDWIVAHPTVRAKNWIAGFDDLRNFCVEQQRHFLPSAFVLDNSDLDIEKYALVPCKSGVVDLSADYLSSLMSDSRSRVKRALIDHADLKFEAQTGLEPQLANWLRTQLVERHQNKWTVASTLCQLALAEAATVCGQDVVWLVVRGTGLWPMAVLAFIPTGTGYKYQCMVVNAEEFKAGRLSGIGLASLAHAVYCLQSHGCREILNLTAFTEWNNPTSNHYKKPAANARMVVWTQATLAYDDPRVGGKAVRALETPVF